MATEVESAESALLKLALEEIEQEWASISAAYVGAEWPVPQNDDEWEDLLVTDLTIWQGRAGGHRGFKAAYIEVRESALEWFQTKFAPWCVRAVRHHGAAKFVELDVDPPHVAREAWGFEWAGLARKLTGTADVVKAGRRAIAWGAACSDPALMCRDLTYPTLVIRWAESLNEFRDGQGYALQPLLGWVKAAVADLSSAALETPQAGVAPDATAGETPRHSLDFRSVSWFGTLYFFTGNQAACVKLLWKAWEHGTPDIGDATVLTEADLSSERLDAVFRDNPAWGSMIRPGNTKGTHRLCRPSAGPG